MKNLRSIVHRTGLAMIWSVFALSCRIGGVTGEAPVSELEGPTLGFEANRGQSAPEVEFLARRVGFTLFLTKSEAVLALGPSRFESRLRVRLVGATPGRRLVGIDELPGKSHYFAGKDPSRWVADVPHFARVRYQEVYPGIDWLFRGTDGRHLAYDFILAPGADPRAIRMGFEGARGLEVDSQGGLVIDTGSGSLVQPLPYVYQESSDGRRRIAGRWLLHPGKHVGFEVAPYDESRSLVIDPVLRYSTYLGGGGGDYGYSIAVDAGGSATITGGTSSTDFPMENGQQVTNGGSGDVFVTKLNSSGTAFVYSTYLGGSGSDVGVGVALDAEGNAYVTGSTSSIDFPTTAGVFQPGYGGVIPMPS